MGNFIIAQMKFKVPPTSPLQLILLVLGPHVVGPEIEVRSVPIVAKADMAVDSAPEVAVFVKFGPVALDIDPGWSHGNLSGQGPFLGRGVPAKQQAENHAH